MRRSKISSVFCAFALLAACFLWGGCRVQAHALSYEDGVRCRKTASVINEEERTFRLNYQLWTDASVSRSVEPRDVILLLDTSAAMGKSVKEAKGEKETQLDWAKKGIKAFLQELSEASPNSRAGLVLFGENTKSSALKALDQSGLQRLEAALDDGAAQASGSPDYAAALQAALKLAGESREGRELCLITLASGAWGEDTGDSGGPLESLQKLRELGGRSYTLLLCTQPEERVEEFWQAMSSAPVSSYHYVCGQDPENSLLQIRRDLTSDFSAEVVQKLDPRFEIDSGEQRRLRSAGAHLDREQDGAWTVSWEADLPRQADSPWTASLSVRARKGFPGGNDIPTDREGSGVYRFGKELLPLTGTRVNVALCLECGDVESDLFLGEKVWPRVDGRSVEEAMVTSPEPVWFGKGMTGSFSYLWETLQGAPIGSLEQLTELCPDGDTAYRLKVTFRPRSSGVLSVGTPVKVTEAAALYRLKVHSGTIRIRGMAEPGTALGKDAALTFQLEHRNGRVFTCTARAEADPQSGRISLEGELKGLPYGVYMVTPVSGALECREALQVCRLGVWTRDDTVSVDRDSDMARFTLEDSQDRE